MKYNIRRWNPILIAIPDIGIGLMWGSLSNVVAFYGYLYTNSAEELAKIYSVAAIIGAVTQVIVGILSDKTKHRWGRRTPWLVYGMILAAISISLWSLATNFNMFLLLSGISCMLVNVAQCAYYTMVMEVVDKDQIGYANTLSRTSATLGMFLMGWLAGFLWDARHPSYTFFTMAAIILLSTILIVPILIKERPENYTQSEPYRFTLDFLRNKEILKLFIITFLFFGSNTLVVQMAASLFAKSYQFSEHTVGKLGMFQAFASLCFGFTAFKLIDAVNRKYILLFSTFGLAATFILLAMFLSSSSNSFILYGGIFIYGLFFIAGKVCIYTVLSMIVPNNKLGEYIGLLNFCIALPQFFFSIFFGYIIDAGYYKVLLPFAAFLYLGAFFTTITMRLTKYR
ncbi:MAG: MFS transporter [Neisseriales bacterium]|nr:MAG: MFS transporter [Neisseriales bacterium]